MFSLIKNESQRFEDDSDTVVVLTINDVNQRSDGVATHDPVGQLPGNQNFWIPGEVWLQI